MTASCPMCSKASAAKFTPFCSDHCRKLDLNRWFTGAYAVPAVELDDVDPTELDALEDPENGPHS